jgi:hypothetical protein
VIFYHGTSQKNWNEIQREGVLWGRREVEGFHPSRCTYLATDKKEAESYGDVVLSVDYEPKSDKDNYSDGCWQLRVYDPIPTSRISRER